MKKSSGLLLGTLLLLQAPMSVQAQQRGDWVLGQWRGDRYWFPGVVEHRARDAVTIAYDDGTRETVRLHQVRRFDWDIGTWVQCRWNGGNDWYAGEIVDVSRSRTHIEVLYEDGDREQLPTGACRSE